jgi:DNA-binding transcriptional LysR family regulator
LDHIRYARAVERTGSFSAAARECRVSQPALSKAIAQLEGSLGGKLFDRSTLGVRATAFGEKILPLVAAAMNSVDALQAAAHDASTEARHAIRIGVSPVIDSSLVARAFAASRELLPERNLIFSEANMTTLREALVAGELDLVVIPAISPIRDCHHQAVSCEPLAALLPPARREAHPLGEPIELRALRDDELILVTDQCGLTSFTLELFAAANVPLRRYQGEATTYQVLEEWSELGLGAAIVPLSKLTRANQQAYQLSDGEQRVQIEYEAVWREDSRKQHELAELVRAIAA